LKMRMSLSIEEWARYTLRKKKFITVQEVARMLGISTKTAGKLLKRLEDAGIVERWSRRAYRVKMTAEEESVEE